jgi:arsenite-transporting ATPase
MPAQRGILRTLRPAAQAAAGVPLPGMQVLETLGRWRESLREIQSVLTAETTSVRLVLTPERVVIAESRRTLTSLGLYGVGVDQVVVNRVFPESDQGTTHAGWLAGWNEAQQRGLQEVRQSFAPLPIVITPYLSSEPVGVDALGALAEARTGDIRDILAICPTEAMTVRPDGGGYLMTLPLPLVKAVEVDLKRRDDELLISVGDHRRVLSLPSVLRRCVVTGARVRDSTLRVRFVPDEKVWPRHD